MKQANAEITRTRYNPATQAFEALVTLRFGPVHYRYAVDYPAPITMPYTDVSKGLIRAAMRQAETKAGLRAAMRNGASAALPHAA